MYGYNPMRQGCLACDDDAVTSVDEAAPPAGRIGFAAPTPNPAAGPVRLAFDLPAAAAVRLEIFDVQGRRVLRLLKDELDAGPHSVTWDARIDGRPAPAGVYYARLQVFGPAGDHELQRKIVIQD